MALLNYTTTVAARKTMAEVQTLLGSTDGVRSVMATFDDNGKAVGIAFAVATEHGMRSFTLPIRADEVYATLLRQKIPARYQTREHAERVAWRIVKDWLEAQLAIIESRMVSLEQVMLPYMHGDDGRTMFELYRDTQLALPAAASGS